MDMVSQAGAMALAGLLPAVHSFACFLTPRANEQIYNNASEGTKVIYAGSLVGIVPAGPGHSHQSVRDIALMASVPGMSCLEPYCEAEVDAVVDWAIDAAAGPVYIRLISVPWDLGFDPPAMALAPGRGTLLREGADLLVVTTGPVMVSQAWAAAERLGADGIEVGLVALPWLKDIDGAWLAELAGDAPIATIDNHYVVGGQGDAVVSALAAAGARNAVTTHGVRRTPVCGRNDEALREHGLDADSLAGTLRELIGVAAR